MLYDRENEKNSLRTVTETSSRKIFNYVFWLTISFDLLLLCLWIVCTFMITAKSNKSFLFISDGSDKMDVEALHLLRRHKEALEKLPNPSDSNIDKFESVVSTTMSNVQTDIKKVSSYAVNIDNELKDVRELVKLCSIKIGEQIKELMKNDLLKGKYVNY